MAAASSSLMRSALLLSSLTFAMGFYCGMAAATASLILMHSALSVSSLTLAVNIYCGVATSTAAWPPPPPRP